MAMVVVVVGGGGVGWAGFVVVVGAWEGVRALSALVTVLIWMQLLQRWWWVLVGAVVAAIVAVVVGIIITGGCVRSSVVGVGHGDRDIDACGNGGT